MFYKVLDSWQFAFGMGNHLQISHMMPYKFDFGDVQRMKDYDTVSHRQVSITEWADLYYGGWIRLDGCDSDRIAYRMITEADVQIVDRKEPDALRRDYITGDKAAVFEIRVPAGKYELLVISGDEAEETAGIFTILNNGLQVHVQEKKGHYAMEEMAVVVKCEGYIRLQMESKDEKPWKLNGLLLRKERALL